MATSLGAAEDRIQLLVQHVDILLHTCNGLFECSKGIVSMDSRPGIVALLNDLSKLQGRDEAAEPLLRSEGSRAAIRQPFLNGDSEQFATQAPPKRRMGNSMEVAGGVNLAPPVQPRRNDASRSFGSKPMSHGDGILNYSELLNLYHGGPNRPSTPQRIEPRNEELEQAGRSRDDAMLGKSILPSRVEPDSDNQIGDELDDDVVMEDAPRNSAETDRHRIWHASCLLSHLIDLHS